MRDHVNYVRDSDSIYSGVYRRNMIYITLLLVASALFGGGDMVPAEDCKKMFTPSPTAPDDCTTFTGAPGATDEIPCYVYDVNCTSESLEWPPEK